ncbi:MAG: hypothetical protein Q4D62_09835 [Planctomycetia bacterium]|nr:hypothetical protein [Planctomycetia bacterium]
MKNRSRLFRLELLEERNLLSTTPLGDVEDSVALFASANFDSAQTVTFSADLDFSGETLCQMAVDGTSLAVLSHDTSTGYLRLYQWESENWQLQTTRTFANVSQFGQNLAIDGRNILVDSGKGVSIFHWNGTTLSETVLSSAGCVSASLDGDIAVIGGENSVSVYRNTILGWQQEKFWSGSHGQSIGANVLYDAATERLFVADYTDEATGAVSVYTRDSGKWTLQQTLSGEQEFGCSLSVDGNTLAVGAGGNVTLYEYADGTWVEKEDKFTPISQEGLTSVLFGSSVSLSGDRLWVGDSLALQGTSVTGAVYTFEKTSSGWEEGEILQSSASGNVLRYGESVFLCEDFAVVMVPGNSTIVTCTPSESDKDALQVESILLDGNQIIVGFSEILSKSSEPILRIGSETLSATEILHGNKVVWTLPDGFSEKDYTLSWSGISDLHGCSLATTEWEWTYDKTVPTVESFSMESGGGKVSATVTFSEEMVPPLGSDQDFLLVDETGKSYPVTWDYDKSMRTVTIFSETTMPAGEYTLWVLGGAMGWCDLAGNPLVKVGFRNGEILQALNVSVELGVTDENSQPVEWLHEWQSHGVELYAISETDISGANLTVELHYRPDLFTLEESSLPAGWSVSEQTSGTLILTGLSGNLTVGEKTLLGEIRFEPVAEGGIALDTTVAGLPVEELGLRVASISGTDTSGTALEGSGTIQTLPKVYPVLYDLDDSGSIDIDDLILFAQNFSKSADASPMAFYCDLDHSGTVDIDDLILFAQNFSRSPGNSLMFASNYPAAWETGQNLVLAEKVAVKTDEIPVALEQNALDTLSEVVIERATTEFGITVPAQVLETVTFRVADLGGNVLATQIGNVLWIDQTAAGCGWYLDATPYDDTDDVFDGQVDLLSVLFHEWGHLAGEEHSEENDDWMGESIAPGVRRLPDVMDKIFGEG